MKYKKELNALNHMIMEAKQGMENHCHKFKNGQVQWCPQVTMAINKILFWKSILKQETGSKVGLSILRTRARKARIDQIPYPGDYQIATLHEMISKAYKQFNLWSLMKIEETCGWHNWSRHKLQPGIRKRRLCGNKCDEQKRSTAWPTMWEKP